MSLYPFVFIALFPLICVLFVGYLWAICGTFVLNLWAKKNKCNDYKGLVFKICGQFVVSLYSVCTLFVFCSFCAVLTILYCAKSL